MRPLPWQPPLELAPAAYSGNDWRTALPLATPTPQFDAEVRRLMHGDIPDELATAVALAAAPEEWWDWLVRRWDALREHQYAWIGVEGRLTRLFSMRPLPWQPPLELAPPPYTGNDWRTYLPVATPTPQFDAEVRRLMHGEIPDELATATALAGAPDEWWGWLVQRWDAIREHQRQQILSQPGCIPDTHERQIWLSRLRAARRRVLAMAEYARIRQAIGVEAAGQRSTSTPQRVVGQNAPPTASSDAPATQQPYFQELDQREPVRLARVEPSDLLFEEPAVTEERR
jgi:hypothetical protein